jgi:predicted PurR-regulated permease PerM
VSHARREDPFLPEHEDITGLIPRGLRISAALAWRFIVVAAALYAVVWVIGYLSVVIIPLSIALLLSALLAPAVQKLVAVRFPRGLATAIVLVAGLAVLGGLLTFVITQFSSGLPQLQKQLNDSLNQIKSGCSTARRTCARSRSRTSSTRRSASSRTTRRPSRRPR